MSVCSQAPIKVVEVHTLSKSTRTSRLQPLLGMIPLESTVTSADEVQSFNAGPPSPESVPPAVRSVQCPAVTTLWGPMSSPEHTAPTPQRQLAPLVQGWPVASRQEDCMQDESPLHSEGESCAT